MSQLTNSQKPLHTEPSIEISKDDVATIIDEEWDKPLETDNQQYNKYTQNLNNMVKQLKLGGVNSLAKSMPHKDMIRRSQYVR